MSIDQTTAYRFHHAPPGSRHDAGPALCSGQSPNSAAHKSDTRPSDFGETLAHKGESRKPGPPASRPQSPAGARGTDKPTDKSVQHVPHRDRQTPDVKQTLYPQQAFAHGYLSQRTENSGVTRSSDPTVTDRKPVLRAPAVSTPTARSAAAPAAAPAVPAPSAAATAYLAEPSSVRPDDSVEATQRSRQARTRQVMPDPGRWSRTHIHYFSAEGRLEIWVRDYETSGKELERLVRDITNNYRHAGKQVNRIVINGHAVHQPGQSQYDQQEKQHAS